MILGFKALYLFIFGCFITDNGTLNTMNQTLYSKYLTCDISINISIKELLYSEEFDFFQKIIMLRTQFLSTICLLLWGKGLVTPFPHSFLFSVTFLTVNIFWGIPSIEWCEKRQTFIPIWEYKHMPLMSPFYFLTWQIFSGNCLLTHMHKISQPKI